MAAKRSRGIAWLLTAALVALAASRVSARDIPASSPRAASPSPKHNLTRAPSPTPAPHPSPVPIPEPIVSLAACTGDNEIVSPRGGCEVCANRTVAVGRRRCEPCPAGTYYFRSETTLCIECAKGCAACVSPTECSACAAPYALSGGLCRECPPGSVYDAATRGCVACASGYDAIGGKCVSRVPLDVYFLVEEGIESVDAYVNPMIEHIENMATEVGKMTTGTVRFGVGSYGHSWSTHRFRNGASLSKDISNLKSDRSWRSGKTAACFSGHCGDQLYAFMNLADPSNPANFDADAFKLVVWVGNTPASQSVNKMDCQPEIWRGTDVGTVVKDLQKAEIRVAAFTACGVGLTRDEQINDVVVPGYNQMHSITYGTDGIVQVFGCGRSGKVSKEDDIPNVVVQRIRDLFLGPDPAPNSRRRL